MPATTTTATVKRAQHLVAKGPTYVELHAAAIALYFEAYHSMIQVVGMSCRAKLEAAMDDVAAEGCVLGAVGAGKISGSLGLLYASVVGIGARSQGQEHLACAAADEGRALLGFALTTPSVEAAAAIILFSVLTSDSLVGEGKRALFAARALLRDLPPADAHSSANSSHLPLSCWRFLDTVTMLHGVLIGGEPARIQRDIVGRLSSFNPCILAPLATDSIFQDSFDGRLLRALALAICCDLPINPGTSWDVTSFDEASTRRARADLAHALLRQEDAIHAALPKLAGTVSALDSASKILNGAIDADYHAFASGALGEGTPEELYSSIVRTMFLADLAVLCLATGTPQDALNMANDTLDVLNLAASTSLSLVFPFVLRPIVALAIVFHALDTTRIPFLLALLYKLPTRPRTTAIYAVLLHLDE